MSISARLSLGLLTFSGLPVAAIAMVLEYGRHGRALTVAVLWLVLLLVLLVPLARGLTYLIVGRDLQRINGMCQRMREGKYEGSFVLPPESEEEHELIRLKRHMNWMLHAVSSREQRLQKILSSEMRRKEEFQRRSTVDALTGIFNRGHFEEIFQQTLDEANRQHKSVALLLIDCDGFKQVNDLHGHQVGDDILRLLGAVLKGAVRENADIPFRYGGDEFGVILSGIDGERLRELSESVRRQFEQGHDYDTTLSIGGAFCRGDCRGYPDETEFKRLADEALYEAKHRGKNRIVIRNCGQCQTCTHSSSTG